MSLLTRSVQAVWKEVVKPETFSKGDEFGQYIRDNLFPKSEYVLIHKTHDCQTNDNDFVETPREPDFKLICVKTGAEFYVEAKYRSLYHDGSVEWCKPYQFKRYKEIAEVTPLYIVLGVGGKTRSPDQVFFIPLYKIKYAKLFKAFLREYEVPLNRPIKSSAIFNNTLCPVKVWGH
jgi:hypothetical protein